jgi:hypothetical protein
MIDLLRINWLMESLADGSAPETEAQKASPLSRRGNTKTLKSG